MTIHQLLDRPAASRSHGLFRLLVVCASLLASNAATFEIEGRLEVLVQDAAVLAGITGLNESIGQAILAAAGSASSVALVEVSLAANPDAAYHRLESGEALRRAGDPLTTVDVSYSVIASISEAGAVAKSLRTTGKLELGVILNQAVIDVGGGAPAAAAGLQVLSHSVAMLAYEVFGSMGGSANLTVRNADGTIELHEASPARWNFWHPRPCAAGRATSLSGSSCACQLPRGLSAAAASGVFIPALPADGGVSSVARLGQACGAGVPPAPRGRGVAVLLALRGGCSFLQKAESAERAGYCGLVVANERLGAPHPLYGAKELPDMTAEPSLDDAAVGVPAWIVGKRTGSRLLTSSSTGALHVDIRDVYQKVPLGNLQSDELGLRDHHIE